MPSPTSPIIPIEAHPPAHVQLRVDPTLRELSAERGIEHAACVRLTGIYHDLIRYRAEA